MYVLVSYLRNRNFAIEAGVKYLLQAAFSSAFLLFGMALVYFEAGSMNFSQLKVNVLNILFSTGLGLMLVAIGFKLALVPFHMWTADVYQGAPAPVTAFIATASKGAILCVFIRFLYAVDFYRLTSSFNILSFLAIFSMLVGNLLALKQHNIKRLLAYSSIAHMGYMIVAFLSFGRLGIESITFYILTYFITTLSAFGIIILLSTKENDAEQINNFRGLFWHDPFSSAVLTIALLSLAGIPLTAGFIGKFYILNSSIHANLWGPTLIFIISSVIGLFYYLRIITSMFSLHDKRLIKEGRPHPVYYVISSVTLSFLAIAMIWFGIFPESIIQFIKSII